MVGRQKCKNCRKRPSTATSGQTGSRNMAKTAKMKSQLWTSYSTSYTLWGLSRRYLVVLRRDLTIAPIISCVWLKFCAVATRVSYVAASSAVRNYFLGAPSRDLFSAIDSRCSAYQHALQIFTPSRIRSLPDGATFGAKHDFSKLEHPCTKSGGLLVPDPHTQ